VGINCTKAAELGPALRRAQAENAAGNAVLIQVSRPGLACHQ
jgi:hypothetical protein